MADFKPCNKREKIAMYKADGTRDAVYRCAEQTCEQFQKEVIPEVCQDCKVRQFVNNQAKAAAAKPVPLSQQFQINRVGPHTPTAKERNTWLPCSLREAIWVKTCCGGEAQVVTCNNAASKYVGQEVVPMLCQSCPVRQQ